MKKVLLFIYLLLMVFVFDTKLFNDSIYNLYNNFFSEHDLKIVSNENLLKENNYHNELLSGYVSETDDYTVHDSQELINVYFTAINKGYDNLTFYCDESYKECMDDINNLDNEDNLFSNTNQLVNVYNSYNSIESSFLNGRVDIKINRKYSKEDIEKIDKKINDIIDELRINNYSDDKEKIKVFHDYLANTNTYDKEKADKKESIFHSDLAIGTLFEGKSICSGYTDTMSLFLDKLNIKNVRIATKNHVWNALYYNEEWLHIDLTWDDPVTSNGSDIILYNYFMINTDELLNMNDNEHYINNIVYDFIN